MLQIAKRTTVGLIVLLAMPLTVWMSGWHWQWGTDYILKALFAMTETVTSPWGRSLASYWQDGFCGVYAFGSKQRLSYLLY